jgi:hypothetical protein
VTISEDAIDMSDVHLLGLGLYSWGLIQNTIGVVTVQRKDELLVVTGASIGTVDEGLGLVGGGGSILKTGADG